jgi:acyl-coenzyme A synthetase/AMP-(fatty) acid ligase
VRRAARAEGSRLEAFVVVSDGEFNAEDTAREILKYCSSELSAPERPAHIEVGRNLPLDAMGKPTAW